MMVMSWGHDSSDRALTEQAQVPEFKPKCCQNMVFLICTAASNFKNFGIFLVENGASKMLIYSKGYLCCLNIKDLKTF
jgi:hypothetical protein